MDADLSRKGSLRRYGGLPPQGRRRGAGQRPMFRPVMSDPEFIGVYRRPLKPCGSVPPGFTETVPAALRPALPGPSYHACPRLCPLPRP